MKKLIIFLGLMLWAGAPAWAEKATPGAPEAQTAEQAKEEPVQGEPKSPGEYECKYYKVTLPDDWKAIIPPTDQQGTINAIFATNTGNTVVTLIVGPNGGADTRSIAAMFAEQFKASKPPVDKNGQFSFTFPIQNGTAQAIVSGSGPDFMVTTIAGSNRLAQNFLRDNVHSENYAGLMPK